MLLTDEEVDKLHGFSADSSGRLVFRKAIRDAEAAILAKLASAELPEPAGRVMAEHNGFVRGRLYRIEDRVDGNPLYTSDQLTAWGNIRYAQGAAAQLAEKPEAYGRRTGDGVVRYCMGPDDVFGYEREFTVPLYTRRQA